jgi:hypothetical protein
MLESTTYRQEDRGVGSSGLHRRWPGLIVLLLMAVALVVPARAQIEMLGLGAEVLPMASPINTRSVDSYGRLLGLDQDQQSAAKELLKGYREGMASVLKGVKEKAEGFEREADGDMAKMQENMIKMIKETASQMGKLESSFFEDLRVTLTPAQEARWANLERARRREIYQKIGMVYGESVDLGSMLTRASVDMAGTLGLADLIESYEADLDRTLQARQKMLKDLAAKYADKKPNAGGMGFDPAMIKPMMDAFKDWTSDGKRIRDLNRQYARRIADVLPEASLEKFERERLRRTYPPVYRESEAQRMMTGAMKLRDLAPETKAELESASADYAREAGPLNETWTKALDAKQEKVDDSNPFGMFSFFDADSGNQELADAAKARKALDAKVLARVEKILGEERAKKLNAEDREVRDRQRDFGPFEFDPEDLELFEVFR